MMSAQEWIELLLTDGSPHIVRQVDVTAFGIVDGQLVIELKSGTQITACNAFDETRSILYGLEANTKRTAGGKKITSYDDTDFNEVWNLYIKSPGERCKKSKHPGYKKWLTMKSAGLLPELPLLLRSIKTHQASKGWKRDDGDFVPLLATFLHQRSWENEIDGVPQPQEIADVIRELDERLPDDNTRSVERNGREAPTWWH